MSASAIDFNLLKRFKDLNIWSPNFIGLNEDYNYDSDNDSDDDDDNN